VSVSASRADSAARRSWFAPVCASGTIILCGALFVSCLNPRPEELPSDRDGVSASLPPGGVNVGAAGTSSIPAGDNAGSGTAENPVDDGSVPGEPPPNTPAPATGTEQGPGSNAPDAGTDAGADTRLLDEGP
jgi:hypothetical protein